MYGLIDCNNFYVSCERVFKPDLIGKPVVVLSNNDGCVIARSEEAKKMGIQMGDPFFKWEKFFHENNVTYFSSNYVLYGDMSARVMATIRDLADDVTTEVYSIDEAFLDLSTYAKLNLAKYGKRIVNTVKQNTGIPVSLGIANTKTLAKIASKFAKRYKKYGGVCIINTEEQREKALRLFDIGDVWGIGHQYKKMLNQNSIYTAWDFIQKNENWIRKHLTINGVRILKELQGIPCVELEQAVAKKSICTSRAFGSLITDYSILCEAVSEFTVTCAKKLREQHTAAGMINVFIHTNPFRENSAQFYASKAYRLEVATNSSSELTKAALRILKEMFAPGYELKKAGVIVSEIVPENAIQGNLFDTTDRNKLAKADRIMDKINKQMGKNTLKLAVQGYNKKWKLNNNNLSKRYTTNWNELLEIQ